jgi:hypothetical protein
MDTIRKTADASEARLIQQRLTSSGIPSYVYESSSGFEVQISKSDFEKAEMLLSLSVAPPASVTENPSGPERVTEEVPSPAQSEPEAPIEIQETKPLCCLRCQIEMDYVGEETFKTFGWFFEGSKILDIYACSNCGHVEFFLPTGRQTMALSPQPLSREHTTIQVVANEYEARIVQQLLISSGIDSYMHPMTSGFYEIQVREKDVETAKALVAQPSAEDSAPRCPQCKTLLDYVMTQHIPTGNRASSPSECQVYLCPNCYQLQRLDRAQNEVQVKLTLEQHYDLLSQVATRLIDENKPEKALGVYERISREFPQYAEESRRCIEILKERISNKR